MTTSKVVKTLLANNKFVGKFLKNNLANWSLQEFDKIEQMANNSEVLLENASGKYLNYIGVEPTGVIYVGQTKDVNKRFGNGAVERHYDYGRIGEYYANMGETDTLSSALVIAGVYNTREEALQGEEDLITMFNATNPAKGLNVCARSKTHKASNTPAVTLSNVTKYAHAYSFVGKVKYAGKKGEYQRFSSRKQAVAILGEEVVDAALKTAKTIKKR